MINSHKKIKFRFFQAQFISEKKHTDESLGMKNIHPIKPDQEENWMYEVKFSDDGISSSNNNRLL